MEKTDEKIVFEKIKGNLSQLEEMAYKNIENNKRIKIKTSDLITFNSDKINSFLK